MTLDMLAVDLVNIVDRSRSSPLARWFTTAAMFRGLRDCETTLNQTRASR
jgi:hypothetical protein